MKNIWRVIPSFSIVFTIISVVALMINNTNNNGSTSSNFLINRVILENNTFGDIWLSLLLATIAIGVGTFLYGYNNNSRSYKFTGYFCASIIVISIITVWFVSI